MTAPALPRKTLGGLAVPPLALGSWNTWDRMDPDDAVAMIRRAADLDAGFFDVAYYNMGPHAENSRTDILFGQALRESGVGRDEIVLCGKLWLWDWPRQSFRAQLTESLERAGLERFDTLVVGDYTTEPDVARIVADVNALVGEGLVGGWGINNWRIEHTRAALAAASDAGLAGPSFAQLKYGIARRAMAEGASYGPLFADGTLALQASDVFEGGILATGRTPGRKIGADVGGIRARIAALYPEVARIAAGFRVTPAALGIAFCLTHPAAANVLFGASRIEQLEQNHAALALVAERGPEVREALAGLQADVDVRDDGAW
ncbi:aldo/keto reductase [Microbacterium azadirachtae]|uniref:aldo/keto reductase n=1 Tax=Microbacterium azadirachtae TaxID=582680 RepID=UPI00088F9401|nr:aldo/keto reductase [Microbacterium azadirachtae]SDM32210.1 Predicted oxidoreductase [Microbacterium azadirachtae]SEG45960.1 Predicted oxidoreductase [Microbacterium azadirachtae]SEG53646.1 Predicted oxidoreductase [Microbacterium azadirachtae]